MEGKLEGVYLGLILDIRCVEVLVQFDDHVYLRQDSDEYFQLQQKLLSLIQNYNLNTITPHEVATLYINRHISFLFKKSRNNRINNAKVISKKGISCQWPKCCSTKNIEVDHILPRSSYSAQLEKYFVVSQNSKYLCSIHNQLIKGSSIGIGLSFRKFLT